jgi:hypothetical protein
MSLKLLHLLKNKSFLSILLLVPEELVMRNFDIVLFHAESYMTVGI